MRVHLRYFAIIRETLGRSEETRDVENGTTAGTLFDQIASEEPRLAAMKRSVMLMVNQEYVPASQPLGDGDELALIPPVSGGEAKMHFRMTTEVLYPREAERIVADPATGATVTFTGTVRDNARGRAVRALDYEAYAPAAEKMMAKIGEEIRERWGIDRVAIIHRMGLLKVGEASVVIAMSSAHRDEACRYAIERLKEIVPIWKKELYEDGAIWVGSEADYQRETGHLASTTAET
jgi:molybdopterin converting factor subunit 1